VGVGLEGVEQVSVFLRGEVVGLEEVGLEEVASWAPEGVVQV